MPLRAYKAKRSKLYAGEPLYPHRHEDGMYVASHSRYEADYIRVETLEQLEALVRAGYSARMSNPDINQAPSIIVSKHIEVIGPAATAPSIKSELSAAMAQVDLDVDSVRKRRVEQSLLRALLLGGNDLGACVLCGEQFPENMLVAAHVKRRSDCSDEEKRDFMNVAALMCKLGCDDLFEKGYVYVEASTVRARPARRSTSAVNAAIEALAGRSVPNWTGSQKYYDWHKKRTEK